MKYSAIIFDFDGVIADSANIKEEGMKMLFPDISIDMNNGGTSRYDKIPYYYEKSTGQHISDDVFKDYLERYDTFTRGKVLKSELSDDIVNFVKKSEIDFYIVSGTPTDVLIDIVDKLGLLQYFKGVFGCETIKKREYLSYIAKCHGDTVIYIGDQDSDYLEARKANVKFKHYKFGENTIWEIFR